MEEYQILILSLIVGKINISIEKGIYLAPQSRHVQSLLLPWANLISRKNPLFFEYMVKPYHPSRAMEGGYYIIIGCNDSIRQNNEKNIGCDGVFYEL